MALDPQYFSLSSGLKSVWNGSQYFTDDHKKLVISAIPGLSSQEYPSKEEQLDQLQVVIVASEFLRGFESQDQDIKWLSDTSREFPETFRRFVHEVASYFHDSGKYLPKSFVEPLSSFIKKTKSHVAVLNYDNLLYDAFKGSGVLAGYTNGALIDGFLNSGFAKDNLDRRDISKLGWYLHLHGSPLFVGNHKLMRGERAFVIPNETSHIVLTHVEHKPLVIGSSPILKEYWSRLPKALNEAIRVILFGYSGCDIHLNDTLISNCINKDIHIVEWSGSAELQERLDVWKKRLEHCSNKLHPLKNPLEFNDWDSL